MTLSEAVAWIMFRDAKLAALMANLPSIRFTLALAQHCAATGKWHPGRWHTGALTCLLRACRDGRIIGYGQHSAGPMEPRAPTAPLNVLQWRDVRIARARDVAHRVEAEPTKRLATVWHDVAFQATEVMAAFPPRVPREVPLAVAPMGCAKEVPANSTSSADEPGPGLFDADGIEPAIDPEPPLPSAPSTATPKLRPARKWEATLAALAAIDPAVIHRGQRVEILGAVEQWCADNDGGAPPKLSLLDKALRHHREVCNRPSTNNTMPNTNNTK